MTDQGRKEVHPFVVGKVQGILKAIAPPPLLPFLPAPRQVGKSAKKVCRDRLGRLHSGSSISLQILEGMNKLLTKIQACGGSTICGNQRVEARAKAKMNNEASGPRQGSPGFLWRSRGEE